MTASLTTGALGCKPGPTTEPPHVNEGPAPEPEPEHSVNPMPEPEPDEPDEPEVVEMVNTVPSSEVAPE